MQQCPICKEWKAKYYKCYWEALRQLIRAYPEIAETANEWLLLDQEYIVPQQHFFQTFAKGVSAKVASRGTYSHYLGVVKYTDLFLIYLCRPCVEKAQQKLDIGAYELYPFERMQCPCCGYYTIEESQDICSVCFWQYDGWALDYVSAPNHMTLRQGRKNYRVFGASEERFIGNVRRPKPEEYPEYHQ